MSRPRPAAAPAPSARRAVAVAATTQTMVVLDTAVLAIALPWMAGDLHISAGMLPWVMNAYALPFAGCLLLGGRICDLFGPVTALRTGLGLFAVASLGAGLAPSLDVLLLCRGLQGVGGALLSPASLALLTGATAAGAERERAIGVWSIAASVGASASALLGGVLTQTLGWRWVLLINVLIAPPLFLGSRGLGQRPAAQAPTLRRRSQLDVPGVLLFLLGFASLNLAATADGGEEQMTRSLLAGVAAVAGLTVFVLVERRVRHPLLPLRLLRSGHVAYTNGAAAALLAGTAATGYYSTLYAQEVSGLSPLATAGLMLPATVAGVVTARRIPRLVGRWGERSCRTAGPVLTAVAQLGLAVCMKEGVPFAALIPIQLVLAVGSSIAVITLTSAASRSLPPHQSGLAGGLITASGQSGSSIGLAALTGIAAALTATAGATSTAERSSAVVDQVAFALPVGAVLAVVAAFLARRIPLVPVTHVTSGQHSPRPDDCDAAT